MNTGCRFRSSLALLLLLALSLLLLLFTFRFPRLFRRVKLHNWVNSPFAESDAMELVSGVMPTGAVLLPQ